MLDRLLSLTALAAALAVAPHLSADPGDPNAGRVLMVEHSGATRSFVPQADPVRQMVRAGLLRFTAQENVRAAWLSLVSTQDTIGLKVFSSPGAASGTRQPVVAAIIETLLDAGIAPEKIVIWDKRLIDLRLAGYLELAERFNVRVAGAIDRGFDPEVSYPNQIIGRLVYGDLDFQKRGEGVGRNSYVSTLLTREITRIVNITPLLNHNLAGVSGVLYGLGVGSVDNVLRFEDADRLSSVLPELYALPEIGDRVALNVVDGLICQYRGEERTLLHYSTPLNQVWFSKDPVAVDVLALIELARHNKDRKLPKSTHLIYENAALLDLGVADPVKIKPEKLSLD
jgi:hypothetical protein